jgi:RNA polymerase sigma factor (TIGR02999 family)
MGHSDLTRLLNEAARGSPAAAERLLPLVYDELRGMARRQAAGDAATVEPTALVHEAWVRLSGEGQLAWDHRGHFFAAAATAMRRILVEHARRRRAGKRGAGRAAEPFVDLPFVMPDPDLVLDLDAALQELQATAPREARVVELRWFAGLQVDEVAAALGVSVGTVERDWRLARARLVRLLGPLDGR